MGRRRRIRSDMVQFRYHFWDLLPISVIPALDELRTAVIEHGSNKRFPKWRFRFADDFGMEIQPQPLKHTLYDDGILFKGVAIQTNNLNRAAFEKRQPGQWRVSFVIRSVNGSWNFKARYAS